MRRQDQFEGDAYELVTTERVYIADHQLGHNQQGELDVWIEAGEEGKRFLSQITVGGNPYAVRKEPYTKACYILRARDTGRYWFLDENIRGFWLQNESFFGARTFGSAESLRIRSWLAQGGNRDGLPSAEAERPSAGPARGSEGPGLNPPAGRIEESKKWS